MVWSFLTYPSKVVFLIAPYSKKTIEEALEMADASDLIPQFRDFNVLERSNSSNHPDEELRPFIEPYIDFSRLLDAAPRVWMASDPPRPIYEYLRD